MATKRQYTWFLYPLDGHTNEAISQRLGEENIQSDQLCEDGVKRNIWQCENYSLVAEMLRNKIQGSFKFDIYKREGKHGKIKQWKFSSKKKKNKKLK